MNLSVNMIENLYILFVHFFWATIYLLSGRFLREKEGTQRVHYHTLQPRPFLLSSFWILLRYLAFDWPTPLIKWWKTWRTRDMWHLEGHGAEGTNYFFLCWYLDLFLQRPEDAKRSWRIDCINLISRALEARLPFNLVGRSVVDTSSALVLQLTNQMLDVPVWHLPSISLVSSSEWQDKVNFIVGLVGARDLYWPHRAFACLCLAPEEMNVYEGRELWHDVN